MIREALQFLQQTYLERTKFETLTTPGAPHDTWIRMPDGSVHQLSNAHPPRRHQAWTMQSFIELVKKYMTPQTIILVDDSAVQAVLNADTYRDDVIVWPLTYTPQYAALRRMDAATQHDEPDAWQHGAFIRMLRNTFPDAVDPGVLTILRTFAYSQRTAGQSQISQAGDSMGRQVDRAVTSEAGVPDVVNFTVAVFNEALYLDVTIPCFLSVEFTDGEPEFELCPEAGRVQEFKNEVLERIGNQLRSTLPDLLVVAGRP